MEIVKKFEVTKQQMADLLACAFEGGINYWCDQVLITEEPKEEFLFASDVLGLGGKLTLEVEDEMLELTQEMMLKGISKTMDHYEYATVDVLMNCHDAESADVAVQYALFDKVVYG